MATYAELLGFFADDDLRNKVLVAVIVAADTILNEDAGTTNHANRLIWAKGAYANPTQEAKRMTMAVLAANKSATVQQITDAGDSTVQTNVDAAVNLFATGE